MKLSIITINFNNEKGLKKKHLKAFLSKHTRILSLSSLTGVLRIIV